MRKIALIAFLVSLFLAGCAGTVSIGGKPVLGFESEKDKDGKPMPAFGTVITQNIYNPQIQSPSSPPGTPPTPPVLQPSGTAVTVPVVAYATIYKTIEDPTKRAFVNSSPNFIRLQIDGNPEEIRLQPYQSTADISLNPGDHRVKVTIERPTENFGTLEIPRFLVISVRPEDHWMPVYIAY